MGLREGSLTALFRTQRRAQTEERRRGNFLFSLNFAIENIKDVQQKSPVSHISLLYWRIQDVVKWHWRRRTIIINGHNLRRFIRVPVSNIQPSGVTGRGGARWTLVDISLDISLDTLQDNCYLACHSSLITAVTRTTPQQIAPGLFVHAFNGIKTYLLYFVQFLNRKVACQLFLSHTFG